MTSIEGQQEPSILHIRHDADNSGWDARNNTSEDDQRQTLVTDAEFRDQLAQPDGKHRSGRHSEHYCQRRQDVTVGKAKVWDYRLPRRYW